VVEVFHRRTGETASLVAAVSGAGDGGGPDASDLMVVRAADPAPSELDRRRAWIAPLTLSGPMTEDVLGVVFELYDLPAGTTWYRVRAEVRDPATGALVGIPSRPAGRSDFRSTWDRRARQDVGPTLEYFTVAVSALPAGVRTLRMVVDFPGGSAPLAPERSIELR
jgi:hypothetical protein